MKHERTSNHNLIITLDPQDREVLQQVHDEDPEHFGHRAQEADFFEGLIANSELDWVNPADTGDLTDAPLLGTNGGDEMTFIVPPGKKPGEVYQGPLCHGFLHVGGSEKGTHYTPILERWGWESYQVRALLQELLDHGRAVLRSSW